MNKSKKSILNALAALTQMFVVSIIGLILNKTIINVYGSDYNGINSTITQIVSTLMILEGGFSLASNVALFEPFGKKDYTKVNGILAATAKRFFVIGVISFIVGLIIIFIYPFTVTTQMPRQMIVGLMFTALIPVSYNLAFNMKYRVMILTDQKEYVISLLTAVTYLFGNGIAIFLMLNGSSIFFARVAIMAFMLINYWIIAIYCKKKYQFARLNVTPDYRSIKGTKSVVILKITSVVYSSMPIVIISTIPGIGVLLASVYAVYKSIIAVVKDSLTSITNAPRLAFGALLSEGRSDEIKQRFNQYEMLSFIGISTIVGTTILLIIPFVELYTKGVQDVQYKDTLLAIILLSTVILEILHIPSGQIIQMKGDFSVARKIQSVAFIILAICMIIGRVMWGFYGIVMSVLVAALSLAIMEIYYTNAKILNRSILQVLKNMIPCIVLCSIAALIGLNELITISNYFEFVFVGSISVIVLGTISVVVYYIIDKESLKSILKMFKNFIIQKK